MGRGCGLARAPGTPGVEGLTTATDTVRGSARFSVRFWGVRGSLSCPGPEYVKYGGNTSCLEVRCGPHLLILDGGSGMRPLGKMLMAEAPIDADIFFTHTHLDHIVGLPFFAPLYQPSSNLRLWAGHLKPRTNLRDAISGMMVEPLFPVPLDVFASKPDYHDFEAGDTLHPREDVVMRTTPLNHPNGATGYRIDFAGKSLCYITDCEHEPNERDPLILDLIQGADYVIYDSTYTEEEYPKFEGWGHSTWQEGVRLADAAEVKTLVIFHHDPSHDDAFMDRIAADAAAARPGTLVAREGLEINL
jgi:phosphoribosyl 1,2-cyclic phosphodiesterase